ncbi:MAG: hypothetical protein JW874_02690 [Spirochaetales bacterium]|nr:hypothetical protein [Spirochaetales bacterium]
MGKTRKSFFVPVMFVLILFVLPYSGCGNRASRQNSKYIEMTWTVKPTGKESKSVWYFHFLADGTPLAYGGRMESGKTAYTMIENELPTYLPFLADLGREDFFDLNRTYDDKNGTEYIFFQDKTGNIIYYTNLVADTTMKIRYTEKLPPGLE